MSIATTDPLADFLSRLKTAVSLNKPSLRLPHSQLKLNLAKILAEEGFINSAKVLKSDKPQIEIDIDPATLKRTIKGLNKISKPGRRVYVSSQEIPTIRQGLGVAIVSTPKGLMLGHRAKARRLGGELICEVW